MSKSNKAKYDNVSIARIENVATRLENAFYKLLARLETEDATGGRGVRFVRLRSKPEAKPEKKGGE